MKKATFLFWVQEIRVRFPAPPDFFPLFLLSNLHISFFYVLCRLEQCQELLEIHILLSGVDPKFVAGEVHLEFREHRAIVVIPQQDRVGIASRRRKISPGRTSDVNMITGRSGAICLIRAVVSKPSIPGISLSTSASE